MWHDPSSGTSRVRDSGVSRVTINTPAGDAMARKLIIDTDPGVDDALAIFMALASPKLDVIGLTTVFGNAATDVTTRNALVLLDVAGRAEVPVARGADDPVAGSYLGPVPQVHGHNGLGDATLPDPTSTPIDVDAADFIRQQVMADPGNITLLPLGPLTNIAVAIDRHPEIVDAVDEVVLMGGNALVPGNATPEAGANIHNDPEGADVVFGAGWPVTMVGLDVTHTINLERSAIDRITAAGSPTTDLLGAALPCYRDFFASVSDVDGIYLHDPSAVAYLLDPDAFVTEQWPIRVETESFSRGKTWPNMGNTDDAAPPAWRGRPPVTVCTEADGPRVAALIESLLTP